MKLREGDPIMVYWVDSMSWGGWQHRDEVAARLLRDTIHHVSVGFYMGWDTDGITLRQSQSVDMELMAEVLKIPWGAVTRVKRGARTIDRVDISEDHSLYLGASETR